MFQGSGFQLCGILELAAAGAGAVVAPLFVLQSGQRLLYEDIYTHIHMMMMMLNLYDDDFNLFKVQPFG